MKPIKLIEKLMMATAGSNSLSAEVYRFLVENERAADLFCWQEDQEYVYPPLTESLDVSSETFVEKKMELDIGVKNHTCLVTVSVAGVEVCKVGTAGKDCIPRAICAAGISYMLETKEEG